MWKRDDGSCAVVCADDSLAYTTESGDVVQLNVKTNKSSVIVDNATLVNILAGSIAVRFVTVAGRPFDVEKEYFMGQHWPVNSKITKYITYRCKY